MKEMQEYQAKMVSMEMRYQMDIKKLEDEKQSSSSKY